MAERERPTTIRFPAHLKKQLKLAAAERNTTMEDLVAAAVRAYFSSDAQYGDKTIDTGVPTEDDLRSVLVDIKRIAESIEQKVDQLRSSVDDSTRAALAERDAVIAEADERLGRLYQELVAILEHNRKHSGGYSDRTKKAV